MQKSYDKGSLEVFYNDGTDKLLKQSYSNLKAGVTEANLVEISEALALLAKNPIEELIVLERHRFVSL